MTFSVGAALVFWLGSKARFSPAPPSALLVVSQTSMATTTATSAPQYSAQERVLCYHGPLVYEAKVLKTKNFDEASTLTGVVGPHYLVHYKGWKQTWDEWVPESRLLRLTEQNLELQKSLQVVNAASGQSGSTASKAQSKSAPGVGRDSVSTRAGTRKDGTRGTKRAREDDESSKKPEMKLTVPELLKTILVDDWEAVTKNNQLVTLPRNPTALEVLEDFATYVKKKQATSSERTANRYTNGRRRVPGLLRPGVGCESVV